MAKKKKKKEDILDIFDAEVDQYIQHFADSTDAFKSYRDSFNDKESMLTGKISDDLTLNTAKSRIFDPRLSTIVIERVARIAANIPTGRAYATSKDDIGKNKLMNLLLEKYAYRQANSQFDFLTKIRLADMYSLVYGVQFALVDWVDKNGYEGPDVWIIPIRDCFPQPGAVSIEESDWFDVATLKSKEWIKSRKGLPGWKNIDKMLEMMEKGSAGTTKSDLDTDRRTEVDLDRLPNIPGDKVNPKKQIITEYRKDKWITFSSEYRLILREIDNPHKNGELPIVAKYAFPLLDSIYGLGEFERGKTLQFAINSLINLYMDGVKFSLYPPIQINDDGVVPSSIKMAPAEKWLVDRPNVDVQVTQLSPQGLNTFQSTYSFLIAALMNQAGTTDTSVSKETDISLGKTPEALKMIERRENSRDSWDRYMLEEFLLNIAEKFISLLSKNLKKPVAIRLFGAEMEDLENIYPDSVEMFDSMGKDEINGRAEVTIKKSMLDSKWDYIIDEGSTLRKDPEEEQKVLTDILKITLESPNLEMALNKSGKTLDVAELFRRWLSNGVQDWNRIIVDKSIQPERDLQPNVSPQQPGMQGPQGQPGAGAGGGMSQDPEINSVLQQIMSVTGGVGGIPNA